MSGTGLAVPASSAPRQPEFLRRGRPPLWPNWSGAWWMAGSRWADREGMDSPITLEDVLIIAPYNA